MDTIDRETFDREAALTLVDGDEELLTELVEQFLEDYGPLLAELRSALEGGDAETAARAAHTLKGSASTLAAGRAAAAAYTVERLAREGKLGEAAQAAQALETSVRQLVGVLKTPSQPA